MQALAAADFLKPVQQHAWVQRNSLLHHRLRKRVAHVMIEAAQRQALAEQQIDLRPQGGKNAGEFDRDIAATHQRDAAGQGGQGQRPGRR